LSSLALKEADRVIAKPIVLKVLLQQRHLQLTALSVASTTGLPLMSTGP
jgi:hypothetical protein